MAAPIKTLALLFFLAATAAAAQTGNAPQRYIEVTGSADALLAPTVYYYSVTLLIPEREEDYSQTDKKSTVADVEAVKQKIAALLKQLNEIIREQGVTEEAYIHAKYDIKLRDESDVILLKIKDAKQLASLAAKLGESKICIAEVVGVYNPAIEELKVTLRATAFKNAKEKALKIAALSGDKLGPVLFIKDRETHAGDDTAQAETGGFANGSKRYDVSDIGFYSVNPKLEESINKMISVRQTLAARFVIE